MNNYNILITNDDGIGSPGLRAAVQAVMGLGQVAVVAPSHQQTGTGRALTGDKQARLQAIDYEIDGVEIQAFHCDCSPAMCVRHSLATLFREKKPDLLVSGINYGENLGVNITGSGTVGAAIEAACVGIPGIAISKQTDIASHQNFTKQDWSASIAFITRFAKYLLTQKTPVDVECLKIDVPDTATPSTEFKVTNLSRVPYYLRRIDNPTIESRIGDGRTMISVNEAELDPDSDVYVFAVEKLVSVTPLSIDLTSRITLTDFYKQLS